MSEQSLQQLSKEESDNDKEDDQEHEQYKTMACNKEHDDGEENNLGERLEFKIKERSHSFIQES
jgi:hypothetical protein